MCTRDGKHSRRRQPDGCRHTPARVQKPGLSSDAPNISPNDRFKQGSINNALAGCPAAGRPGERQRPEVISGILTQPGPRQSAVHYDNSVHIQTGDVADPTALRDKIKRK